MAAVVVAPGSALGGERRLVTSSSTKLKRRIAAVSTASAMLTRTATASSRSQTGTVAHTAPLMRKATASRTITAATTLAMMLKTIWRPVRKCMKEM